VQSFGLLMATLISVNYILAITWLPVSPPRLSPPQMHRVMKYT
jgi:hypothetical protein